MLYAADLEHGGLADRVLVSLEARERPEALWWLSVHGIYRRVQGVLAQWNWARVDGEPEAAKVASPGGAPAAPQVQIAGILFRLRGRRLGLADLEVALPAGRRQCGCEASAQSHPGDPKQLPRSEGERHSRVRRRGRFSPVGAGCPGGRQTGDGRGRAGARLSPPRRGPRTTGASRAAFERRLAAGERSKSCARIRV